jgi:hypothetical protein
MGRPHIPCAFRAQLEGSRAADGNGFRGLTRAPGDNPWCEPDVRFRAKEDIGMNLDVSLII